MFEKRDPGLCNGWRSLRGTGVERGLDEAGFPVFPGVGKLFWAVSVGLRRLSDAGREETGRLGVASLVRPEGGRWLREGCE